MHCCIEWVGDIDEEGYGFLKINQGKLVRTNRMILEQKLGRCLHRGLQAVSVCNNRLCVNPNHIIEAKPGEQIQTIMNNYPILELNKQLVYTVRYLLEFGQTPKTVTQIVQSSIDFLLFDGSLTELVQLIYEYDVWKYIPIKRWEKIEAIMKLDGRFSTEVCFYIDHNPKECGSIHKDNKNILLQNYVWQQMNQSVPPPQTRICHSCGNEACIRPSHLYLGKCHYFSKKHLLDNFDGEIIHLREEAHLSFRQIGILLANKIGRETPIAHTLISQRYQKIKNR